MPVKTAMKRAIGTESTPSRRICPTRSGAQVRTSARARPVSRVRRPTYATKPSRAVTRDATEGCTFEKVRLGREARQRAADVAFAQPLERAVAQLAHPLAGDAEHAADFLQGVLPAAVEAEVEPEHLGVPRRQGAEGGLDLLGEEAVHRLLFRVTLLVGDEPVDQTAIAFRVERRIQPDIGRVERRERLDHVEREPGGAGDLLRRGLAPELLAERLGGADDTGQIR